MNHRARRQQRLCPWCSRSFTKDEHLSRHIRSHTKEKPFVCTVCNKAFSRNDSLLRHRRNHRTASGPPVTPGTVSAPEHVMEDSVAEAGNGDAIMNPDLPAGTLGVNHEWDFDFSPRIPVWLATDDFDLDALNSEIMLSTSNWLVPPSHPGNHNHNETVTFPDQLLVENMPTQREDRVRKAWFTFLAPSRTGHVTPEIGHEQTSVDEAYREKLAVKLQPHIPTSPLPSTEFLNLCIQMYFTKFDPLFPIVHAPTFRPSSKSSLLLLSICSIGSLFIGSPYAVAQGSKIFETLNKAILSSWERYMSKGASASVPMIQAALIGQTFGLLSGKPKDLLTVQSFHGTVLAWARKSAMFKAHKAADTLNMEDISESPELSWKMWIVAEEYNRIATGLHIHDAEISELFQTDPFLRHSPSKLPPLIEPDCLWAAKTAGDWKTLMLERSRGSTELNDPSLPVSLHLDGVAALPIGWGSYLRRCMELEALTATITEENGSDNKTSTQERNVARLIDFHNMFMKPTAGKVPDAHFLQILWHAVFLSLYANINRLELAIGRDGDLEAQNHVGYVQQWACSQDGQRCALHAALILRELGHLTLGAELPIYVPRIVFRAGIICFCYTKFGTDDLAMMHAAGYPELENLGHNCQRLLFEANGFRSHRPKTSECSVFCGLVDVLHRAGHWGISRKFASILTLLLPEGADDEGHGK